MINEQKNYASRAPRAVRLCQFVTAVWGCLRRSLSRRVPLPGGSVSARTDRSPRACQWALLYSWAIFQACALIKNNWPEGHTSSGRYCLPAVFTRGVHVLNMERRRRAESASTWPGALRAPWLTAHGAAVSRGDRLASWPLGSHCASLGNRRSDSRRYFGDEHCAMLSMSLTYFATVITAQYCEYYSYFAIVVAHISLTTGAHERWLFS